MIEKLTRTLAGIRLPDGSPQLSADEIIDILWLARDPPPESALTRARPEHTVPADAEPTDADADAEPADSGDVVADATETVPDRDPPDRDPPDRGPPDRGPPGDPGPVGYGEPAHSGPLVYSPLVVASPDEPAAATEAAFQAVQSLPHALELTRSLRRFRQVTRRGRPEVDIEASVQATAESRHRVVVTHRPKVRALDLALVVDAGASMRVWDRTFGQFERILAQVGAFRTVSRWDLRLVGSEVFLAAGGGARHPAGRIVDPSGSRLVLVATDGVGDGWYASEIWRVLGSWAAVMPTALIQTLPGSYWSQTAIGRPYLAIRSVQHALPNACYARRRAPWAPRKPAGVPLPVIPLDAGAIANWAEAAVAGTSWAEAIMTVPPPAGPAPSVTNKELGAPELVQSFLTRASPHAIQLARALASAPTLTVPLVEVVQERLVPEAGIAGRAELFVSGLLQEIKGGYRFIPDAAERLQRGMTSFEQWETFNALTAYLSERPGLGGDLLLRIRDKAGLKSIDSRERPIAALAGHLADRLDIPRPRPVLIGPSHPGPKSDSWTTDPRSSESPMDAMSEEHWSEIFSREPVLGSELAPWDEAELLPLAEKVVTQAIITLNGAPLNVVDVGRLGIGTFDVRRNKVGTPVGKEMPLTSWRELGGTDSLSRDSVIHAARMTPDVSDVLVCSYPGDPLADQAMGWLREVRPQAPTAETAAGASVRGLLREAIADDPLTQPYALFVLKRHPATGQIGYSGRQLFSIGSRRGARTSLLVRCELSDEQGTAFAVLAQGEDLKPRIVSVQSTKVPPGGYEVTAVLERPGKVTFIGAPGLADGLVEDRRSWAELIDQVPRRFNRSPGFVHLICAVEISGQAGHVAERLSRIRQIITTLDGELMGRLWVSLISYGPHSYHLLHRGEEPVRVAAWEFSTADALGALDRMERRGAVELGYPYAAMVEDMLAMVERRLPQAGPDRTALVTIGVRPPHPPRVSPSQVHPCQSRPRVDWAAVLDRLRDRPGMTLGAICDLPAGRADRAWHRLGEGALAHLDAVDVRQFAADLGLIPQEGLRFPFPVLVESS